MFVGKGQFFSFHKQIVRCYSIAESVNILSSIRSIVTSSKESSSGIETVKLAYSSYESTEPLNTNSTPVIILHGLLASKSNWNSLSKSLYNKTGRKMVTVDARNHGASPFSNHMSYLHMTEDVKVLMEDLEIKKASLIGHSMGGRTAMSLALKYPDLVESLLVLDISPYGMGTQFSNIVKIIGAMQAVKLEPKITLSKARILADKLLAPKITDSALRQFILTTLYEDENGSYKWRANIDVIGNSLESNIIKFPLDESLRYNGPVLFISGAKSDFIKQSDHAKIKKLFPKAEITTMDTGHWPHAEKPVEFLSIATKFLTSAR